MNVDVAKPSMRGGSHLTHDQCCRNRSNEVGQMLCARCAMAPTFRTSWSCFMRFNSDILARFAWPSEHGRAPYAVCYAVQTDEVLDELDHLWTINERAGACGSIGT